MLIANRVPLRSTGMSLTYTETGTVQAIILYEDAQELQDLPRRRGRRLRPREGTADVHARKTTHEEAQHDQGTHM